MTYTEKRKYGLPERVSMSKFSEIFDFYQSLGLATFGKVFITLQIVQFKTPVHATKSHTYY
jgi:hypothetical protein